MDENRRSNILPHKDLQYKIVARVLSLVLLGIVLVGGAIYVTVWRNITSSEFASGRMSIIQVFNNVHLILFIAIPVAVAIVIWLSIYTSHKIAGPLVRLDHGMRHICEGNLPKHPMKFRKGDEHHHLANRFNAMVEKIRSQLDEEQQRAELMKKELEMLSLAHHRTKGPERPGNNKSRKISKTVKGFTLVELMIVVVVVGILAAIAVPNYIDMKNRAQEASIKANMHTLQLVLEDFAAQADTWYPDNLDTRISDIDPTGPPHSVAEGVRVPPFPATALINPHVGYANPFDKTAFALDNLAGGPPALANRGVVYYTSYDDAGNLNGGSNPGAKGYIICAYGNNAPLASKIFAGTAN
jgi:prepilin-type N-terminal cleavage/methylation domain-containing protein